MQIEIFHDTAGQRFETQIDGVVGFVEYELGDGVMAITHTIVPPAIGGRGVAGALVKAAVEWADAQGLSVYPRCSYAEAWMRRHPEYERLRA